MSKKYILLFGLFTIAIVLFAQTKIIAYKSHSGSRANYEIALTDELFTSDHDNFGLWVDDMEIVNDLDSVIRINDTTAIMVTRNGYGRTGKIKIQKTIDTVYNHPVLSGKPRLIDVKKELRDKNGNTYANSMDSVKFIGFEEKDAVKVKKKKKNSLIPVAADGFSDFPPSLPPVLFFAVLIAVSFTVGLVYYKYDKLKQSIR
jgi:hypothetical protein